MSEQAQTSYADRLAKLEGIVERLQRGTDLDETMKLYEEGKLLHESCVRTIEQVEALLSQEEPSLKTPSGSP